MTMAVADSVDNPLSKQASAVGSEEGDLDSKLSPTKSALKMMTKPLRFDGIVRSPHTPPHAGTAARG